MDNTTFTRLPDAELDVMQALWHAEGAQRPSELRAALADRHDWSLSTIQVLLGRLHEKGFVTLSHEKRFCYYAPAVDEETYRVGETHSFLERLHGGSVRSLMAALVECRGIDESDLDEITRMLETRKEG